MAKLFSAIKCRMGSWDYYIVKMRMHDVANEIKFSTEVSDESTLDTMLQRELKDSRAKNHIVRYLQQNEERFFNSLVVAALGGNPKFYPVNIEDDPRFEVIKGSIDNDFGILSFTDDIKTYALDGQHRLYAIKQLTNEQYEYPPPPGFADETISVIFLVPKGDVTREEFQKSYRRVFSALNRHAKPTDQTTNIIMDEDDRFAILTRRLISDYEFFKWDETEGTTSRIDLESRSEAISGDSNNVFMTLQGLYYFNAQLLWTDELAAYGAVGSGSGWKEIIQITPDDDHLDELYHALEIIWDGILLALPDLNESPAEMRVERKHFLFRPIAQKNILAPLVRRLLDEKGFGYPSNSSQVADAIKGLNYIPWDMMHNLWRDFIYVYNPDNGKWLMTNENRKQRLQLAYSILIWVLGIEPLNEDQINELQGRWASYLIPPGNNEREDTTFEELIKLRAQILSL